MPYSLAKISPDTYGGDSGPMSRRVWPDRRDDPNPRPTVGACIMVGSINGRSYAAQDWWRTSIVTEILVDEPDYMKIKTMNSVYEWRKF